MYLAIAARPEHETTIVENCIRVYKIRSAAR